MSNDEPRKIWARGLTSSDEGKLIGVPLQEGHLLVGETGLEGTIDEINYRDKTTIISLTILLEVNNDQEIFLYD